LETHFCYRKSQNINSTLEICILLIGKLSIIVFHSLIKNIYKKISLQSIFIVSICTLVATLIRPQTNSIFFGMFCVFFSMVILKKYRILFLNRLIFSSFILGFLIIANIPIFIKNKKNLDTYTLSTQTGYSFFEGHNQFARGSWCGDCGINPQKPVYQYIRNEIKDFDTLGELQQSEILKDFALNWIKKSFARSYPYAKKSSYLFFTLQL
jgi:hypothetical protein